MSGHTESDVARRLSAVLFKALEAAKNASGLTVQEFMESIGSTHNAYHYLRNGNFPNGMTLLRLIYMLDMDHDEIGKLIDIAGEYAEKRALSSFGGAPVRATPKTAKAGSARNTRPAL